ncbi:ABC transporter permease [Populibacterium corticicola]|uniref:ABC transporter permease n=1 Tax=Populibacterium corticicola TaxID=1812826 RepID=A0ABW5XFX0_9MICO
MSDVTTADQGEKPGAERASQSRSPRLSGSFVRNIGLVLALIALCIVGVATTGERFANTDNLLTILRLASAMGVLAIGMTFVITAGGIDLSVGAVMGLATVWATTLATQTMAQNSHWTVMVFTALAVGLIAGVVNGVLIAYGKVVAFIATLAMMVAARGLAEIISNRQTQIITVNEFKEALRGSFLGVPNLVWLLIVVSVLGWILLNRTTFGRRTVAVGGNPEAARLAGINVKRHLVYVYALCGLTAGIAAVMMLGRTNSGSSTTGYLYELDAIAAVVVGGTLLVGGRGTIVGTLLGVLLFTILTNVFVQNNMSTSAQAVVKGAIIVIAVLLQQRFAQHGKAST